MVRGILARIGGPVRRGSLGGAGLKAVQAGLTVLAGIALARWLGPEAFGAYAFAYAVVTLLALPAAMGFPQLVVRETARAEQAGQWALLRGLWGWCTRRVLGVAGALAGLLAGIAGLALLAGVGGTRELALLWGAALIPLIALGNLRGAALRGLRHPILGQLPELLLRPGLFLLLLVAGFWVAGLAPRADLAMALHAGAAALAFATGAWLLARHRPAPVAGVTAPVTRGSDWWQAAWPLGLLGGFHLITQQVDLVMLGLLRPDAEAGLYRVAVQAALLVVFGLQAINDVVAPYLARLHGAGEREALQRLVRRAARGMLAAALPVALLFVLAGETVLTLLFGAEYAGAWPALVLIALGQLVSAALGPAGMLLNMTGHERTTLRVMGFAAGLNVVLNAALIPFWGLVGAALASLITLSAWNILLWLAVRRHLGMDSSALGLRAWFRPTPNDPSPNDNGSAC